MGREITRRDLLAATMAAAAAGPALGRPFSPVFSPVFSPLSGRGGKRGLRGPRGLPRLANLILNNNSDHLPVVAAGSAVGSWTDDFGNTASVTGSKMPTYLPNQANGHAALNFDGVDDVLPFTQGWAANAASTGPFATANPDATVIVVLKNTVASASGWAFTNASSGGGWALASNKTRAGHRATSASIPYTSSGFTTIGQRYFSNSIGSAYQYTYVNGSSLGYAAGQTATAQTPFCFGGGASGFGFYKGPILGVFIWNVGLSHTEYMQAIAAINAWAGEPAFGLQTILFGDSITAGFGVAATGLEGTYPYQMAQSLGLPLGAWQNLGRVGATGTQLLSLLDDWGGVGAALGVPVRVMCGEWKNQDTLDTTGQAQFNANKAVLQKMQNTYGINRRGFWSSTDYANRLASRALYNAICDNSTNRAGIMEQYAPIHLETHIGIDGSSPNASPFTPNFFDTTGHMTVAGYGYMASYLGPYISSL